MKYAIIYNSKTGNTKKLAETIYQTLGEKDCQYYGTKIHVNLEEPTVILVGFWTDKGTCDSETKMLLNHLAHKQVFLFGTAGFGGNPAYFDHILANVSALLPETNRLVGTFMCQGKMQDAVKARYEAILQKHPRDLNAQNALDNFLRAVTHPDSDDLDALVRKVKACLC